MALLQSIHLEHLPPSHMLHISLFHSVSNAAFLHQQLLDGNAEFEYAFIDASVVSPAVLFVPFILIT
jgi:EKC/KEOPS complex subunit CGI121/TPRKB